MGFSEKLKRFSKSFFIQEETSLETEEDRFIKFYRNLLSEISSHIEYQRDLTDSVGEESKVLKPFKVEEYAERISELFRELEGQNSGPGRRIKSGGKHGDGAKRVGRIQKLPEPTIANLFFMILALPSQEQPAVSDEIRRRIFSRVAVCYAYDTGRQPAALLKSLYERLKHGRGDVFGTNTEELMAMLRGAATYIDVELRASDTASASTSPTGETTHTWGPDSKSRRPDGDRHQKQTVTSREQLKHQLDATLKIRTEKDRRDLLNPAAGLDFVVTGVVRLTAAFLLLFNTNQLAVLLSNMASKTGQIAFYSALIDVLGFTLVVWTVLSAVGYGRRMARKQLYKRLCARIEELK